MKKTGLFALLVLLIFGLIGTVQGLRELTIGPLQNGTEIKALRSIYEPVGEDLIVRVAVNVFVNKNFTEDYLEVNISPDRFEGSIDAAGLQYDACEQDEFSMTSGASSNKWLDKNLSGMCGNQRRIFIRPEMQPIDFSGVILGCAEPRFYNSYSLKLPFEQKYRGQSYSVYIQYRISGYLKQKGGYDFYNLINLGGEYYFLQIDESDPIVKNSVMTEIVLPPTVSEPPIVYGLKSEDYKLELFNICLTRYTEYPNSSNRWLITFEQNVNDPNKYLLVLYSDEGKKRAREIWLMGTGAVIGLFVSLFTYWIGRRDTNNPNEKILKKLDEINNQKVISRGSKSRSTWTSNLFFLGLGYLLLKRKKK
jgi:hypothetical protein